MVGLHDGLLVEQKCMLLMLVKLRDLLAAVIAQFFVRIR